MYKEAKAVLKKSQEEMKRYSDRNRKKTVEYKVEDRMLLSMKNLIWQMRNRETKKLIERFIKLYYKQDNIILRVGRETKEKFYLQLENINQKRYERETKVFTKIERTYSKRSHLIL